MFNVKIDSNKAWVTERETLTLYSQGYEAVQIEIDFSDEWSSLAKIAVFRAYDRQIDVAMTGNTVEIPVAVLMKPDVHLLFGVYGVNTSGTVVIPTIWADLGIIQPSPNPTDAENYGPPALDLYAQLAALAAQAQEAAVTASTGAYSGTIEFWLNGITPGKETFPSIQIGNMIFKHSSGTGATISDLGPASAYAAAVAGGYTGTYADFQALLQANGRTAYAVETALDELEAVRHQTNTAFVQASRAMDAANNASAAVQAATDAAAAATAAANSKQPQHIPLQITLTAGSSSWENVNCVGAKPDNLIIYGPAPGSLAAAADAHVVMTEQATNKVSFTASKTLTANVVMNVAIFD